VDSCGDSALVWARRLIKFIAGMIALAFSIVDILLPVADATHSPIETGIETHAVIHGFCVFLQEFLFLELQRWKDLGLEPLKDLPAGLHEHGGADRLPDALEGDEVAIYL
jgi:hypothetical protein